MARPEAVGAAMPTTTVARPPFWLSSFVVTTGIAHSGVLLRLNHVYCIILPEWIIAMVKTRSEAKGDE